MSFYKLVQNAIADTLGTSLWAFLPEVLLCATIVLLLLAQMILPRVKPAAFYLMLAGLAVALLAARPWPPPDPAVPIFTGMLTSDAFAVYMRCLLLVFAILFVAWCQISGVPKREDATEFYVLILGAVLGMCLMVSANHMLIVFLGVEMASVPSYVLAGLQRHRRKGTEAALKYAVFGAGCAGVMLYGISLLVGALGTAHLPTMATRLAQMHQKQTLLEHVAEKHVGEAIHSGELPESLRDGELAGLPQSGELGQWLESEYPHLADRQAMHQLESWAESDQRHQKQALLEHVTEEGVAEAIHSGGLLETLRHGKLADLPQSSELAEFIESHDSHHADEQAMRLLQNWTESDRRLVLVLAGLMVMVGLAFKLSAVPFHFWAPDVFEGATAEVAAFLSIASKAAALGLLVRLAVGLSTASTAELTAALEPVRQYACGLIALLAAVTCTFGNLAAYGQTNMKRLLAYSTIAHAGYMMMPVAAAVALAGNDTAGASSAIAAVAFYLAIYLFMNLSAFAAVAFLRNAINSEAIADYAGLIRRSPGFVICLSIVMFSLIGLPPLAGFAAKFAAFSSLAVQFDTGSLADLDGRLLTLLVIGGLNTVISLFYYLRVVRVMILQPEPEDRPAARIPLASVPGALLVTVTLPVLLLGVWWNDLYSYASQAAMSLFGA